MTIFSWCPRCNKRIYAATGTFTNLKRTVERFQSRLRNTPDAIRVRQGPRSEFFELSNIMLGRPCDTCTGVPSKID